MKKIAQEAYHRQRMLQYAQKHGVTNTAIRYRVSRKTVYKWQKRYDGTLDSLVDRSRKPKRSPKAQSHSELKLVMRYAKKYPDDRLLGYEKATRYGYTRSYGCFKQTAVKLQIEQRKPKKARKNKPYQRAEYPGQKLQIDVKYVPSYCVANAEKYYQFTAKDECTRWTYRELYAEHSSQSAKAFLEKLLQVSPFPIRLVQTDNGAEFTNALLVTKAEHKTLLSKRCWIWALSTSVFGSQHRVTMGR